jgi:hypothetical protein
MHGVDKTETLLHTAFADKFFDGVGDVEIIPPVRRFKPKMFGQRFHCAKIYPPMGR